MLPQNKRVKTEQFEALLKDGFIAHSSSFTLRYKPSKEGQRFTFAAVVSKKLAKTAVERNLLKRRVRSVVEALLQQKKNVPPVSAVLFLKKEGALLPFQTLKQEIISIFKKVRL